MTVHVCVCVEEVHVFMHTHLCVGREGKHLSGHRVQGSGSYSGGGPGLLGGTPIWNAGPQSSFA